MTSTVPFVLNPLARQVALDTQRLVAGGVLCRSKFARLFNSVSIKTGTVCEINCKSWRCVKHRGAWAYKWHRIITERLKTLPINLLINLTTAEFVDNIVIHRALKMFMDKWREHYGRTEYIRVTEYNKNHTQPHFHMLISCPGLKLGPMPEKFRQEQWKKLSWPDNIFHWIQQTWGDCLEYYAPGLRRTTVVWCQPPANDIASAKYAVNYITGKNAQGKDEEPDDTWGGRKLCYSKKFFEVPAMQIWKNYLTKKFGKPDPDDKFFWVPNEAPRITGESPIDFQHVPVMQERYQLARYYRTHGEWPNLGAKLDNDLALEIWAEFLIPESPGDKFSLEPGGP